MTISHYRFMSIYYNRYRRSLYIRSLSKSTNISTTCLTLTTISIILIKTGHVKEPFIIQLKH